MNLSTTWKNYLLSCKSPLNDCNYILNEFTTAASEDKCVDIAQSLRKGTFLVKVTDQPHPSIVHSFSYAEGNSIELGFGKRKPFIHSGLGNSAFPLSFKAKKMFHKADMNRYPYQEIFDADSIAQIKTIQPITRTPGANTMIPLRSCQYIPSGIADLILRSNATSAEELVMVAKSYVAGSLQTIPIEVADTPAVPTTAETVPDDGDVNALAVLAHAADAAAPLQQASHSIETIEQNGGQVLQYLMNFSKTTMKDVPLAPETVVGGIVQTASSDCHLARLGSSTAIPQAPNQVPPGITTQASTAEALEMIKTFSETLAENIGHGSGSAPKATKMFVEQWKALGSLDAENPLEQLSETATQILNTRDQSDRRMLIDGALSLEGVDPNVSATQLKNLCNGPLGWDSFEEPNGITSFMMEVPGITGNRSASVTEHVIRLRAYYNVQSSKDEVDSILKKDVIPPRSVEELIAILTQQCKLIKIFTHENSILVINLEDFLEFMSERSQKIRYKFHIDSTYLLKIQYKIDSRINNLCNDAKRFCKDVGKMNFRNFSNFKFVMNDIDNDSLIIDKMPSFMVQITSSGGGLSNNGKRKFKDINHDNDDICILPAYNTNKNPAWSLKQGEKFKLVFKAVKMRKPKACLDFWIRGICKNDCDRKSTHVDKLSKEMNEQMDKFVKDARARASKSSPVTSSNADT